MKPIVSIIKKWGTQKPYLILLGIKTTYDGWYRGNNRITAYEIRNLLL